MNATRSWDRFHAADDGEEMGRTLARGRTTAEGRPRPGAVAPPTTQRSGAGVAAAVTASLARRVRVGHHRARRDRGTGLEQGP